MWHDTFWTEYVGAKVRVDKLVTSPEVDSEMLRITFADDSMLVVELVGVGLPERRPDHKAGDDWATAEQRDRLAALVYSRLLRRLYRGMTDEVLDEDRNILILRLEPSGEEWKEVKDDLPS